MSDATSSLPYPASARERAVSKTFVMLADTLVDDVDVVDLLDRLVHICVDLLDATAAGLLLRDQKGSLTVVASSSEETRLLEVCQLQSDEGPCLDCVRSGAPVVSLDLAADTARWPIFAVAARDAGLAAVTAVPMRLRDQTIGALNLFHDQARPIAEADQELAQAFADVATVGILQQRLVHRSSLLTEQLQQALNSRVLIEQAKGVLTERHGIGMDEAFAALRRHARDHNLKIADAALAVVRGTADISPGPT
jgi:GAF domain-containing protein